MTRLSEQGINVVESEDGEDSGSGSRFSTNTLSTLAKLRFWTRHLTNFDKKS